MTPLTTALDSYKHIIPFGNLQISILKKVESAVFLILETLINATYYFCEHITNANIGVLEKIVISFYAFLITIKL